MLLHSLIADAAVLPLGASAASPSPTGDFVMATVNADPHCGIVDINGL